MNAFIFQNERGNPVQGECEMVPVQTGGGRKHAVSGMSGVVEGGVMGEEGNDEKATGEVSELADPPATTHPADQRQIDRYHDYFFECEERRRKIVGSTHLRTEEGALLENLLSEREENRKVLANFCSPKLKDLDEETIQRVRGVLRMTAQAMLDGDLEALAIVADTAPRLVGTATKYDQVLRIHQIIEQWLNGLKEQLALEERDRLSWSLELLPPVVTVSLGQLGVSLPRAVQDELLEKALESLRTTGTYGRWGPTKFTQWVIEKSGAFDVKDGEAARKLVSKAQEKSRPPTEK